MTNPTFDFNVFIDASKKAFAPAMKFNELAVQGFERVARQQYAFAGELLEIAIRQMQLPTQVKDANELRLQAGRAGHPAGREDDPALAGPGQAGHRAAGRADQWYDKAAADVAAVAKKAA